MRERSLILFTVLAQAAVGAALSLGVVRFWISPRAGEAVAGAMTANTLLFIGPLFGLALLASFFHLGSPSNAWRAFANLRASWLSREILFAVLFAALCGLLAGSQYYRLGPPLLQSILTWLAALCGLALLYSMSRVYMLRTVPAWNAPATLLSFFSASFLLGGLVIAIGLRISFDSLPYHQATSLHQQYGLPGSVQHWMGLGFLLLLGVEFVTTPLRIAHLRARSQESSKDIKRLALRLALVFVGAGGAGLLLISTDLFPSLQPLFVPLISLALILILVAEILGRSLFYETGLRRDL